MPKASYFDFEDTFIAGDDLMLVIDIVKTELRKLNGKNITQDDVKKVCVNCVSSIINAFDKRAFKVAEQYQDTIQDRIVGFLTDKEIKDIQLDPDDLSFVIKKPWGSPKINPIYIEAIQNAPKEKIDKIKEEYLRKYANDKKDLGNVTENVYTYKMLKDITGTRTFWQVFFDIISFKWLFGTDTFKVEGKNILKAAAKDVGVSDNDIEEAINTTGDIDLFAVGGQVDYTIGKEDEYGFVEVDKSKDEDSVEQIEVNEDLELNTTENLVNAIKEMKEGKTSDLTNSDIENELNNLGLNINYTKFKSIDIIEKFIARQRGEIDKDFPYDMCEALLGYKEASLKEKRKIVDKYSQLLVDRMKEDFGHKRSCYEKVEREADELLGIDGTLEISNDLLSNKRALYKKLGLGEAEEEISNNRINEVSQDKSNENIEDKEIGVKNEVEALDISSSEFQQEAPGYLEQSQNEEENFDKDGPEATIITDYVNNAEDDKVVDENGYLVDDDEIHM